MIMNFERSHYARSRLVLACTAALMLLVIGGIANPLAAQTAQQDQQSKDDANKAQAAPPQAPRAAGEGFKWGAYDVHSEFEVGYRVVDQVAGTQDVYKSMVNLREGTQLFRSALSMRSDYGTGRLFDRLDFSMDNWGVDPYNTLRLSFSKSDKYEFRADYHSLNYYNFLPAYSNPLLAKGILFGQHSLDVTYRNTDLELKLFPTRKIRPFVAYSRASGLGPGFTTNSFTGNEFLLNTNWQYASDEYRGGIEIVLPRLVLTVEQGYRTMKNDTGTQDQLDHTGNVTRPFLGETISLDSLQRGYHDRTTAPVTKIVAKYTPFPTLKFSGRYIYSMSDLNSALGEVRSGNLISLEDQLIYSSALDFSNTRAKRPSQNGACVVEWSPLSRLTFLDQFDARSYHVSGSALLATTFFNPRPLSGEPQTTFETEVQNLLGTFLAFDQRRNQIEAEVDLGHGFVARGGHRYTFSEAKLSDTENGDVDSRSASASQQTGIAGLAFRPNRRMHFSVDYEINRTDSALTRTDLLNYDELRFDWRFDPMRNLSLSGRVGILRNSNNQSDIDLKSHNRDYSFALNYSLSERFSLNLDYQRSNILSNMAILLPQTLQLDRSIFDERGSAAGGSMSIDFYKGLRGDAGLRAILNAGDLPFNYYQPFASLTVPLPSHLAFKTLWQDFGYNEKNSDIQDHRSHLFTFSLAYSY